jgi:hypothetical protein
MTLAIGINRDLNIALACVLDEVLDYATLNEAYRAYFSASNAPEDASYKDLNILVSGLLLPAHVKTARQLAEHIEFLAGAMELGIKRYRKVNALEADTLPPFDHPKLCR